MQLAFPKAVLPEVLPQHQLNFRTYLRGYSSEGRKKPGKENAWPKPSNAHRFTVDVVPGVLSFSL